jgi:hypothetical protein
MMWRTSSVKNKLMHDDDVGGNGRTRSAKRPCVRLLASM